MLGHVVKSCIYHEYFYAFCVQINSPAYEIGCMFGRQGGSRFTPRNVSLYQSKFLSCRVILASLTLNKTALARYFGQPGSWCVNKSGSYKKLYYILRLFPLKMKIFFKSEERNKHGH